MSDSDDRIATQPLTEFNSVITKPETRQNHLSQTKSRAESREKADREDAQDVDEDDIWVMPDDKVMRAITRHYDGGIEAFKTSC